MIYPSIINNKKSEIETYFVRPNNIKSMIIDFSNNIKSYILAYYVNEVQLGWIHDGEIEFYKSKKMNEDFLLEARVFNENSELYIWANDDGFQARKRIDYHETGTSQYYDINYAIWGRKKENDKPNWFALEEKERGIKVLVPSNYHPPQQSKVFYKVRNYYQYDEDGMIRFEDARLCSLLDEQGNRL